MSLSRDTLLFGIALIVFGAWLETSGKGGWPFALAGLALAIIGYLGSVVSSMRSAPATSVPVDENRS